MENKRIQLTEQDLHFLVENAVREYMVQEGFWGGMKNLGQKGVNAVGQGLTKAIT